MGDIKDLIFQPDPRDMYLQKAAEAEKEEKRAPDRWTRAAWERIVIGYLELAEMAGKSRR